jgi:hypothetical protein
MRELEPIRRLAPPVEPLAPDAAARIRARALTRRRRRVPAATLLAPAAVAATVAVVVVLGGSPDREVPAQAPIAAAGAGAAPRLLLDGWSVTRVDDWKPDSGEMTFVREGRELEVAWMPADRGLDLEEKMGEPPARRVEVAGAEASVWHRREGDDYVASWRHGALTLMARGTAQSTDAFATVLAGLRPAGTEDWERAMPDRAVTPPEHDDAVGGMLAGLPLPPGFDADRLRARKATRDRYQLRAHVAGAVVCGWLAAWVRAEADGDAAAADRAVRALASSRDWPVLREMNAEGDYPEVVWQYADAVTGNGTIEAGKTLTVEESYRSALCS